MVPQRFWHSGLLIWENLDESQPYHMNNVSRARVLDLWLKLANGKIEEIALEEWLPGSYDAR
jgi:hypothetical protein